MYNTNKLLILALIIGLAFHGSAVFFTLESTYDALIHLFFADHYASDWFEPWDPRWYTGFTVHAYPPLVHQSIAMFSLIGGLKFGLFSVALISVVLFITGVYRFALLMTGNRTIAGYTALLAVFSSTFIETLHIFGQLPSIVGLSVLLHAMPEIYLWIKSGRWLNLFTALALLSVTVTSHHVTPIFGMVFFIFPLIGMALMDISRDSVSHVKEITFRVFLVSFRKAFWRIVGFGFSTLVLIVGCILPYWINSKNNPITQVPIPHGSRDNFLEVLSSGLVFFLIPWGVLLFIMPYIFYRFFSKRYLFFGISVTILTVLGSGGTTPIPRMVLGETAFNILTLDRFTLWATIIALPIFGELVYRLVEGDLKEALQERFGSVLHRILGGFLAGGLLFMVIFSMSLGYFRPAQPQKVKMLPIVNFLNQDQHDQWRYLTLGFGDQMAWLSAQTKAMTVDGNYHSARRLPELTTRAVERLENSKFRGVEGIGSLQQFLAVPEKYHLKYIFSNDKFYDPILYFSGWQRLQQLENGIMVWERLNVPPIPAIVPYENTPRALKLMWGIIPLFTIFIALLFFLHRGYRRVFKNRESAPAEYMAYALPLKKFQARLINLNLVWVIALLIVCIYGLFQYYQDNSEQRSPENVLLAYYDALDFKEFEKAHSFLSPASEMSLEQYMLEVSVSDGLLSSYAKLDSIGVKLLKRSGDGALAEVKANYVTPLEKIAKTYRHELQYRAGSWYIIPEAAENDIPPDQLIVRNTTNYYNHGRRRITTEQTSHEDVLEQPVLEILSAALVKTPEGYAIIGELQNIDRVPADVVMKASLYDDDNKMLASYNGKYHMKHRLMPQETTPFKVEFEGIAWSEVTEQKPDTFNPDEYTPADLAGTPVSFDIQCAGNVVNTDLYKSLTLQEIRIGATTVEGYLYNSGAQEITIPQLLVSFYNDKGNLQWVEQQFQTEGIRIQRKQSFTYELPEIPEIKVISSTLENCYVNGLPNGIRTGSLIPNRIKEHREELLQKVANRTYDFIKMDSNVYVGNPK